MPNRDSRRDMLRRRMRRTAHEPPRLFGQPCAGTLPLRRPVPLEQPDAASIDMLAGLDAGERCRNTVDVTRPPGRWATVTLSSYMERFISVETTKLRLPMSAWYRAGGTTALPASWRRRARRGSAS